MVKETQAFFTMVESADRQYVTDLHSTAIALGDSLEAFARQVSRQVQLMERTETDPDIKGRIEELHQTCRALIRESDALEAAARSVSKMEAQLHRIVGEIRSKVAP